MTVVMPLSTSENHWRAVLRQQGRTITWLARETGRPRRTLYAYSQGQIPPPAEWLARVSAVLGVEVSA